MNKVPELNLRQVNLSPGQRSSSAQTRADTSFPDIFRSSSAPSSAQTTSRASSASLLSTSADNIDSFRDYNATIEGRIETCKIHNLEKIIGVEMECNGFTKIYFIRYFDNTEQYKPLVSGFHVSLPEAIHGVSKTSMYDLHKTYHFPGKNEQNIINDTRQSKNMPYNDIKEFFGIQEKKSNRKQAWI